MNYIEQFNAFGVKSAGILSPNSVACYVRLFLLNNQRNWAEYFPASHSLLCAMTGIGSRNTIDSILKELQENGFIEVKKGGGRKPNLIKLVNLYCSKTEQQTEQQTEHIYKHKHKTKTKLEKENIKEKDTKFAEAVSMTNDEHTSLIEKYGKEAVDWCIEKLNNYKLSSGKRYKSDYRAILSWVIGEWEKNGQRLSGRSGKNKAKISEDPDKFKNVTGWGDIFPEDE